jgi:hypothetical protein
VGNFTALLDALSSALTLAQRQCLAFGGALKKPPRLQELFREYPFAIGERVSNQQLNRLGNEPPALGGR